MGHRRYGRLLQPGGHVMLAALLLLSVVPSVAAGPKAEPLRGLAIHANGRAMPLDTFAELTLLQYSGRSSYNGTDALAWLVQAWMEPSRLFDDELFLVDNPAALQAAGVEASARGRYAFQRLRGAYPQLQKLARELSDVPGEQLDAVESEIVRLYRNLRHFSQLISSFSFMRRHPDFTITDPALAEELALDTGAHSFYEIARRLGESSRIELRRRGENEAAAAESFRLWARMLEWPDRHGQTPLAVIPFYAADGERWLTPSQALMETRAPAALSVEVEKLAELYTAYQNDDLAAIRQAAEALNRSVQERSAVAGNRLWTGLEVVYNRLNPFLAAQLLYGLGVVLLVFLLHSRRSWPELGALLALAAALALHTAGLLARMIMTSRPPVTNLYSSFLFVGWAVALIGFTIALARSRRMGTLIGVVAGFLLTFLSWGVAAERDTLGVLQAVLDTNFWLSTHVVTITLGYAGCLAAGIMGHLYLLQRLLRPFDERRLRNSYTLLYWILAVGLVLSFVGTMLGGIWADQSWGRFWGWDPKENGALLIVLWCAILFHAKAARLVGQQGMAVGAILGILVVMFSWLGVNLMGVGLHSYGFTSGISGILIIVAGGELLFIAAALTLLRLRERNTQTGLIACRVASITRESDDSVTIRLRPRSRNGVSFEAGMHVSLFVEIDGVTYRRLYSFSSAPDDDDSFSLTAKRVSGGAVSSYLVERARPGEKMWVSSASGEFRLRGNSREKAVFIAGGSGIAPIAAMLSRLLQLDREAQATLIFGNRRQSDIIFREWLDGLAAEYRNVAVHHVLEEPPPGWSGGNGRLDVRQVVELAPDSRNARYYVCGPEPMVDSLTEGLELEGIAPERIHEERFTAAARDSLRTYSADIGSYEGTLPQHSARFAALRAAVRPGETVLEAGLRLGAPLAYSCASGRCGECRCKLTSGTVHMLEPNCLSRSEREEGYILSCIAYPESDVEIE